MAPVGMEYKNTNNNTTIFSVIKHITTQHYSAYVAYDAQIR